MSRPWQQLSDLSAQPVPAWAAASPAVIALAVAPRTGLPLLDFASVLLERRRLRRHHVEEQARRVPHHHPRPALGNHLRAKAGQPRNFGRDVIGLDIQVEACCSLTDVLQPHPGQRRRLIESSELRIVGNEPRLGQERRRPEVASGLERFGRGVDDYLAQENSMHTHSQPRSTGREIA